MLVSGSLGKVTTTHEKLDLGMMSTSLSQQTVCLTANRILDITDKQEREPATMRLMGLETIPWRCLPVGDGTIAVTGIRLEMAQAGHIVGRTSTTRCKHLASRLNVYRIAVTSQLQGGGMNHGVALPADVS